jgi:hypothetical protein
MKNNQAEIYDTLVLLSVVLNQPQDPKRLKFYAETLNAFDLKAVIAQIKGFSTSSKYFPQLVEIIEPLRGLDAPTDELAVLIAAEVIESLYRCSNEAHAKEVLGDKYFVLQRLGGFETVSRMDLGDMNTLRAQAREIAKAYINRTKRELREDLSLEFSLNTSPVQVEREKKPGLRLISID